MHRAIVWHAATAGAGAVASSAAEPSIALIGPGPEREGLRCDPPAVSRLGYDYAVFWPAIWTMRSKWVHTPSSACAMVLAPSIVAGSSAGRALRTISVTDNDSSAWRSSTISEKHSAKYGSSANCGKWTDKASARARIQSADIISMAHHGPSDRE